jgi:hypothetical protein
MCYSQCTALAKRTLMLLTLSDSGYDTVLLDNSEEPIVSIASVEGEKC